MASPSVTIYSVEQPYAGADHYVVRRPVRFEDGFHAYLRQTLRLGNRLLSQDDLAEMTEKVEGLRGKLLGWRSKDGHVFYECLEEDTLVIRRGSGGQDSH